MFRVLMAAAGALALLAPASEAAAQFRTEVHPIQTRTYSTQAFLLGEKEAPAATIAGELRIARFGNEKLPAVILVHGSGGVGSNVAEWAVELNKLGIAVFILDTFTGRGITSTVADQGQLSGLAMLYDSYRALELLARHPRIDPQRIAIMGFSKGATPALYSSLQRFHNAFGTPGVQFAAHIGFYAPCETGYVDDTKLTGAPVRLFHGTADDYVPVGPCKEYVQRLKAAGVDVALFEYEGAHHSFDMRLPMAIPLPQAITIRKCRLREGPAGTILNEATGNALAISDACIERGATVAHSAQALEASRNEVAAFLKTLFKM